MVFRRSDELDIGRSFWRKRHETAGVAVEIQTVDGRFQNNGTHRFIL